MARILQEGNSGPDVREVQGRLNAVGGSRFAPLNVDGAFGPRTAERVREFQASRDLKIDGKVGPATRAALGTAPAAPSTPGKPPAPAPAEPGKAERTPAELAAIVDRAFGTALTHWRLSCVLSGVVIAGPVASGGVLTGPPIAPLMEGALSAAGLSKADSEVARSAAFAIGGQFLKWQLSVRVPGLPWYPSFAAVPGPVAPPIPNKPSPLATLFTAPQHMERTTLLAALASGGTAERAAVTVVHERIADLVSVRFNIFLGSAMCTKVMGSGRVPSFKPPAVPVGPVVGGTGNSLPGCLA